MVLPPLEGRGGLLLNYKNMKKIFLILLCILSYTLGYCHRYDPIYKPTKIDALYHRHLAPLKSDEEKRNDFLQAFVYQPEVKGMTLLNSCSNFGDLSLSGYSYFDNGYIHLQNTACDSTANMPLDVLKNGFKIYDYEQAPIAMFQGSDAVKSYFELMTKNASEQNETHSYLLFGRGLYELDGIVQVKFNVAFNFADVSKLTGNDIKIGKKFTPNVNESIRSAIEQEVTSVFSSQKLTPQGANIAEEAGIRKMMELIRAVIAGKFDSMDEKYLKFNGFIEIKGDWSNLVDKPRDPYTLGADSIYDYAGLELNGKPLTDVIKGEMTKGLGTYINSPSNINNGIIITDSKENTFFNNAIDKFDDLNFKMILWYHYVVESKKMYVKAVSNLTKEELEQIADDQLREIRDNLHLDPDSLYIGAIAKSSAGNPCGSFNSFSAKECWLKDPKLDDLVNELSKKDLSMKLYAEFLFGVTCGFIDEMLSSAQMFFNLGQSILSWDYKSTINSIDAYWKDLWKRAYEECEKNNLSKDVFTKGAYVHNLFLSDVGSAIYDSLKSSWQKVVEIFGAITGVLSNWKEMAYIVFDIIKNMVGNWEKLISKATKWVGAKIGEILGGVLTAFLTGGAIAATKSYVSNMKGGVKFLEALGETWKFRDYLTDKIQNPSNPLGKFRKKLCKWKLLDGCFVAGTSVKLKNGQKAIEKLILGENVLSNTKVTSGYSAMLKPVLLAGGLLLAGSEAVASNDNSATFEHKISKEVIEHKIIYLPLADTSPDRLSSDEQRAVDNTEWTKTEWYSLHLTLKKENGSTTKVQLLRPQWWLDKNHIKQANDVVYLSLPEMGAEGDATVTELAHYRSIKNLEGEDDDPDWAAAKVTGIFEHTAEATYKLSLSNGETLGVTAPHPFYSLDRQCFVAAAELRVQERLLTQSGSVCVVANTIDQTPQQVYNLEVRHWHTFLVGDCGAVVHNNYENVKKAIQGLSTKYSTLLEDVDNKIFEFTGRYGDPKVRGHHPLCKSAFSGGNNINKYNKDDAFCISEEGLKAFCPDCKPNTTIHSAITGRQASRYSAWQKDNPSKIISLEEMIDVEIGSMTDVGIPEDIAKTWMAKALKQMKEDFDIREITQTPWGEKLVK